MPHKIIFEEAETEVTEDDYNKFKGKLAECIGQELSPTSKITIGKPHMSSRSANAGKILRCTIVDGSLEHVVLLKRCYDNPEFLRREVAVAEARRILGYPNYSVLQLDQLRLRNPQTGNQAYPLINEWEKHQLIFIECGPPNTSRTLSELRPADLEGDPEFFAKYGELIPFNYILGVRDRHASNFIYRCDKKELYSVDNEDGPCDSNNKITGNGADILQSMKNNLNTFGGVRVHTQELRKGFNAGWEKLKNKKVEIMTLFNDCERGWITQKIMENPDQVYSAFEG